MERRAVRAADQPAGSFLTTSQVFSLREERVARVALITGIAGQDGFYLAELLRPKGYEIYGLDRPGKRPDPGLCNRSYELDLARDDLAGLLDQLRPDEVYNLAGLSQVAASFNDPVEFVQANGVGAVRLIEAVRRHRDRLGRDSEMFGATGPTPHNEATPFHPRSPYACSKVLAHFQTVNFREAFGLFACCGILFNHESPRRPEHFVTRKITAAAARIKLGSPERLVLGNVDVRRDWGFAADYVEAMWLMLQQDRPDDYVIATGETHSVRDFGEEVFRHLSLDWDAHVTTDRAFLRPTDIDCVCGDASKARSVLGWRPRVTFRELARMMGDHDLRLARGGAERT
jgi:GDPmannose 4,6-dehydratase